MLLKAVDAFVQEHPGLDRGKVIDEALALWYAREQDRAMEDQFAEPTEGDPQEWEAWRSVRDAAAVRLIRPESE